MADEFKYSGDKYGQFRLLSYFTDPQLIFICITERCLNVLHDDVGLLLGTQYFVPIGHLNLIYLSFFVYLYLKINFLKIRILSTLEHIENERILNSNFYRSIFSFVLML